MESSVTRPPNVALELRTERLFSRLRRRPPPLPGRRLAVCPPAECGELSPKLGGTADFQSALSNTLGAGFFVDSETAKNRNLQVQLISAIKS